MLRLLFPVAALLLSSLFCSPSSANEPQKKLDAEKIPAPKAKIEPTYSIEFYTPRTDTREVWEHYGVNRFGRFVPRVIVLPHGAYYSRDLQPYPWTTNRATAIIPSKVD
jgi:hypothetical protein